MSDPPKLFCVQKLIIPAFNKGSIEWTKYFLGNNIKDVVNLMEERYGRLSRFNVYDECTEEIIIMELEYEAV